MEDQAVTHHERLIAGFARRYAKELKRLDALDFDDLLIEGLRLLQEAPAVAERYRTKWEYLHVDEYQDTNRIQYDWIREIARGTAISAWLVMMISPSIRGAVQTFATS